MKLSRLLLFPALLFVSITVNAQWSTASGDGFTIDFPAKPVSDVFTISDRGQSADADRLSVKTQVGLFQIYSLPIPYTATMQDRLDSAFEKMKQAAPSIRQTSRREYTFMGCKAGEFQGRSKFFPLVVMRVVITSEKIYLLGVVVSQNGGQGQAWKFLDSFKLNASCT